MAYMYSNLEPTDRAPYLESEITRLQELCRKNFGIIDDLRKENRKLSEIQMELKDTTTDLAYSLAECPWWDGEQHTETALKILTTFTKNVQYILQLPSFIDPIEQLERYGLERPRAIRFLRRHRRRYLAKASPPTFKCRKCKKRFVSEKRFQKHLHIHKINRKLQCRQCQESFSNFKDYKSHLMKKTNHAQCTDRLFTKKSIEWSSISKGPIEIHTKPEAMELSIPMMEKEDMGIRLPKDADADSSLQPPIMKEKLDFSLDCSHLVDLKSHNETFRLFGDVVCTFKNCIS